MSSLGPRVFNIDQNSFSKSYSEATDKLIDEEVDKIINECATRTREIIKTHKEEITLVAEKLLDKETIDILDIIELIGARPHKIPESISAYIEETKARRIREEKKAESDKLEEKNEKDNDENKKNDNNSETGEKVDNKDNAKDSEHPKIEKEENNEKDSTTKFSFKNILLNKLI